MFIESFAPPPRMLIFGAVDFTAALVRVAKVLGYRVTVCDAREVFATTRAVPAGRRGRRRLARTASSSRVGPTLGPRDAVCVLTHDHKFDVPAIVAALAHRRRLPRRHGQPAHPRRPGRAAAARRASTTPASPGIRAPIGLDLGARTPEETAVSICAEIIALRTGQRVAASLARHRGPDPPGGPHRDDPAAVVLAAGGGEPVRAGGDGHKLLAAVPGPARRSQWAVEAARRGRARRPDRRDRRRRPADALAAREASSFVRNARWAEGQATSLQAGRRRGPRRDGHDAVVVGLGDQPLVPAEAWRGVGRRRRGAPIAVATYDGRAGQPGAAGRRWCGRCCPTPATRAPGSLMRRAARPRGRSTVRRASRPTSTPVEDLAADGADQRVPVDVPVDEAWEVLTDVERIAPCMPGAQLQEIEGDEYRGIVKVKVGPITAQYKGAATFVEKDDAGHRAVLRAEGRDTRGQGNANATITATLAPDGDGTHGHGRHRPHRHRQGRPVRPGRAGRRVDQAARPVRRLPRDQGAGGRRGRRPGRAAGGDEPAGGPAAAAADTAAAPPPPLPPRSPPTTARSTWPPRARPPPGRSTRPATPRASRRPGGHGLVRQLAAEGTSGSQVKVVDSPEPEPVDLLDAAGAPVMKRAAPAVAGLTVLWLLSVFLRRRRRRRRRGLSPDWAVGERCARVSPLPGPAGQPRRSGGIGRRARLRA